VRRPGLARFVPVLLALVAVWGTGGLALSRRAAERYDAAVGDTLAALSALVNATQNELRREAGILAKDPAIVEGALKSDWATLARGASPRMLALTLERIADLLLVVDASGAPLVQVPPVPRVEGLGIPRPTEAVARVAVVNDRAYLLGLAPLPAGMVVVGRRVESLDRLLAGLPSRPAVVVVAGDLAIGGTLPGVPARGWLDAARAGHVAVNGQPWLVRPLAGVAGGSLWALVSEGNRRAAEQWFWFWWALSLVAAVGVAVAAGSVGSSKGAATAPPTPPLGVARAKPALATKPPLETESVPPAPTERLRPELEALYAVAVATGNGDDLVVAAERTLEVACGVARMAVGGLFRFDPAARALVLVAHRGLSPKDAAELRVRPLDESHVGEAVRAGHLVVTDLTRSRVLTPAVRERVAAGGYHTQLALPITVDDRIWGVMALISREPRTFDGDELTLLQAVAHHVGQAVARAALFGETRATTRRLETLTRLAQTLTATLSLDEVLQRVVDAAAELFDSSVARLWLVEDDGEHVALRASVGARASVEGPRRVRVGEGLVGTVVATREPLTVSDVLNDPRTRNVEELRAEGTASAAIVPLLIGDRVLGALSVGVRERHEYTGEELSVLASLTLHAANAINNARRYSEESARRAYLSALLEINTKIGSMAPTETLLASIADEAARLLDVDNAGFRLLDGEDLVLAGLAGTASQTMVRPRIRVGESLSGKVVATGRTLICEIQSVPDVVPDHLDADRRLGYTMFLGVPLRVGDRTIGVLTFRARRAFTARDREIAEAFADQAAIALDHARLYREATRQAAEATRRRLEAEELARLAKTLTESLEVGAVSNRIVESVLTLFAARSSGLWILQSDGSLTLLAVGGTGRETLRVGHLLPPGVSVSGRAVAEGRTVASADILSDPVLVLTDDLRDAIRAAGDGSLVAVPLRVKARLIGTLALADRVGRVFTEAEVELLQAFADQAALALENARLFSLETARRAQIATLAEIERGFATELDPEPLLRMVVERAKRLFDANGVIYLMEDGRALVPRAWTEGSPFKGVTVPFGQGVVGSSAQLGHGLIVNDYPSSLLARPRGKDVGVRRAMAHPLTVQDRLLGVIALHRTGNGAAPFLQEDLEVLKSFAGRAAIALENARLYREARERAERLAALEEVNRLVSSSLKIDEVLTNIAAAVARFFDAPYVSVWVLDPASRRLSRWLVHGDPAVAGKLERELPLGEGSIGWVALHRQPIFWADAAKDPRVADGARLVRRGLRYVTAYPIAMGESVLGAFAVHRAAPSPVTPETASLLGSLAAQAAIALENARLYSETARRLEETGALLEVVEILNSTLDTKRLLKRVAIKIAEVCRVDRCSLVLWESGQVTPLVSQYADGRKAPAQWVAFQAVTSRPFLEIPANARARETRRPVVVNDARESDLVPREWLETFGLKSYLVVPMIRQDQVIGVMALDHCERPVPFEPSQVDLAMTIAGQLALSLENTRLYTEVQERLREATTLMNVGQILSRPGPAAERMRQVAREVALAFGADMVGAYFLDERKEKLAPLGGYHVPPELLAWFTTRPIVLARVPELLSAWREGRAVWSSDPLNDPRFDRDWLGALPPHSVLLASATARREPIGALFVVWWRPGRQFQPSEARLIEGVAAQVGLVMENAELARQSEVKLRQTETLLAVSRTFSSTLDLQALLRHFLRRVARAVDADAGGVWLREGDGEWLEPVVGYRLPPEHLEQLRTIRLSLVQDPFLAEAARTRRPLSSSDVAADPRASAVVRDVLPHRSQLFVPIVAKERVIGGFGLIWYERACEFSESELALMEAIANHAGVAIDNARLFEENRRQVQELSVLLELSQAVTGQLERAALIDAIHAQVARVLDARNMVVALHDEERHEFEVVRRLAGGVPDAQPPLRDPERASGLMSVVRETGRAIRTDDYAAECARHGVEPIRTSAELGRWLGVPMVAGDRVLGVLALRGGERPFTERDERLLTNIAHLAALALRSARLFEERTRAYGELAAAQDQLVRTEKLRALGEMASGVAHDFNNLLASILGRAQLVLQRVQNPQLRQWLQVIERAALDGAQTVRRLQEFTRIRRDEPFVAVDLNEVVREALEITQSRWRDEAVSRGVPLEVRNDLAALPKVAGDPVELREALTNLILNAVDAMPDGGVLTLTTAVGHGEIAVTVSDTGVGIPTTIRDRIFDPFFTTKGPQGTGLGLSMTYAILERHGARITVESEEGRGTIFHLTFRPATELEAPQAAPAAPASAGDVSLRCLVVDDEPTVGAMLRDVLETGGHRAVVVSDGSEAIARFGAEPFDVVFTDLAMPRASGWQVARAIKEMAPAVPVVLVTGFGVELSPEERREHGVDLVLVKPLKIQEILDVVAQVARRRVWRT